MGRLLDSRRTPVSVVEVRLDTGTFVIRIDGFEDKGATWESRVRLYRGVSTEEQLRQPDGHACRLSSIGACRAVFHDLPRDSRHERPVQ